MFVHTYVDLPGVIKAFESFSLFMSEQKQPEYKKPWCLYQKIYVRYITTNGYKKPRKVFGEKKILVEFSCFIASLISTFFGVKRH